MKDHAGSIKELGLRSSNSDMFILMTKLGAEYSNNEIRERIPNLLLSNDKTIIDWLSKKGFKFSHNNNLENLISNYKHSFALATHWHEELKTSAPSARISTGSYERARGENAQFIKYINECKSSLADIEKFYELYKDSLKNSEKLKLNITELKMNMLILIEDNNKIIKYIEGY